MKNKILVLGANGMAGHTIALYLFEQGYDVTILCRKNLVLNKLIKNIIWDEDFDTLRVILKSNYDLIINCIGMLHNACDKNPKEAIRINSFLPHFIYNQINPNTRFIHLSTDCVFSGNDAPYDESSISNGKNIYDVTKATSELMRGENILILRNSIIGPDINKHGIGLFNWFMQQTNEINGFDNWIWSGITTLELAKQINWLIKSKKSGLIHLTNNTSISKYHLLLIFNEVFNKGIKINKTSLLKQIDKTLINTKHPDIIIPTYEVMINEMKDWIKKHKDLYWYRF